MAQESPNKLMTVKAASVITFVLCLAVGVITQTGSDLFKGLHCF